MFLILSIFFNSKSLQRTEPTKTQSDQKLSCFESLQWCPKKNLNVAKWKHYLLSLLKKDKNAVGLGLGATGLRLGVSELFDKQMRAEVIGSVCFRKVSPLECQTLWQLSTGAVWQLQHSSVQLATCRNEQHLKQINTSFITCTSWRKLLIEAMTCNLQVFYLKHFKPPLCLVFFSKKLVHNFVILSIPNYYLNDIFPRILYILIFIILTWLLLGKARWTVDRSPACSRPTHSVTSTDN